jgi:hypothetical protein
MKSINQNFNLVRLFIQERIGMFIVGLLVFIYLATALLIGQSLFQSYLPWLGTLWAAIVSGGVALGTQLARGSLVYFSQANPYTLNNTGHWVGGGIAFLLTAYSCYEINLLMSENNVALPGIISAIGVICAGFLVEVFFLHELVKINTATLANDPSLMSEVEQELEKITEARTKQMVMRQKLIEVRQSVLNGTYPPTPLDQDPPKQLTRNMLKEIIKEVLEDQPQKDYRKKKHGSPLEIKLGKNANGVGNH